MSSDRPPLRARALRVASRLLHGAGLLVLARPLLNRTRLAVNEAGRPTFPFLRLRRGRNAQILIYHRVNDERDPYFAGTPTLAFERQMDYVASRFHVLSLPDLVASLRAGTLPENAIAVTLDDGYRDNYTHAFPILRRYSIPATIFLTTAAIGSNRQLWHDDVFSAFRDTTQPTLQPFAPGEVVRALDTVADRLRAQGAFLTYIRTLPDEERAAAVSRLRDALRVGPPRDAQGLMLSWQEVATMSAGGIRFGSHTATHPILSRVDRDRARRELTESKRTIEERIGVPVDSFAYPNGTARDFLPETQALVRETGYACAVTTIPGSNEVDADLYALRRGTPWDEDIFAFGLRLHYNKLRS